ncbi:dimethylhistidine N-methyltransferase [Synechococcus sp. PROS-7-1]|uniref:L-histidine N(alpha)-methyltransferase n=1 Tax=Synechococcus sp. PROS-7-1 TaxID=1442556 RepID=UPI00164878AD|nr:L-histidine N(alpha)-methyltransferase [Synechococcus sp. PROS-7-1]QNI84042.1 dimethylhistidine N-methyltransferase [Synechococcus sp. PROS-7-1]
MTTLTPSKPELIDLHPPAADMLRLVRQGLQQEPRQLPAWFLYDAEGSRLFDQICEQPEYSLTRTEIGLLERSAAEIATALGDGVIVEFGAGSARKVGPLLNALQPSAYVALDISADHLRQATAALQTRYPGVPMLGICCDHSALKALPGHPLLQGQRRIGFFPGSSLGNFTRLEAVALLRRFRQLLDGGPLLLGLDQPKTPKCLEAAYDDAAGVSAAFARNLLHRLNAELGATFDPERFRYEARWQVAEHRVRMALVSREPQSVWIAGECWHFAAEQPLVTEYSVKYTPAMARALAAEAGWRWRQRWHDPADDLSLHWLEAAD